eukprot:6102886-Pyramimonas_sp.AAC.1
MALLTPPQRQGAQPGGAASLGIGFGSLRTRCQLAAWSIVRASCPGQRGRALAPRSNWADWLESPACP